MDVTISGRHVDVTDAMREHARVRAEKLEKYTHHLMSATVTLAIEGDRHIAEIVAHARSRGDLVAKCQTHDMYASIDQAATKMETQLRKLEGRNQTPPRRGPLEAFARRDGASGARA